MNAKLAMLSEETHETDLDETASSAKLSETKTTTMDDSVAPNAQEHITGNRILDVECLFTFIWMYTKCPNLDCTFRKDSDTGFGGTVDITGKL